LDLLRLIMRSLHIGVIAAILLPLPAGAATSDRVRTVSSQPLPHMDGDHLKTILLEVRYGPGESSSPHSHPCAVLGYVIEGAIRTQLKGEREATYHTGESFYESPNGVHLVSANASTTEPARFLAMMICDHDAPLSVEAPQ
jgi:quercetin dioxygenase-like cupin family protein